MYILNYSRTETLDKVDNKQRIFTICLLFLYLIVLIWAVIFRFQFSLSDINPIREINLIPFSGSLYLWKIVGTILAFIPFGMYIAMLKKDTSFVTKVILITSVGLIFEVLQFILSVAVTDITDLIGNAFGGMIGIGIYYLALKIFKNDNKASEIINIYALIATICVILFLALMLYGAYAVSQF